MLGDVRKHVVTCMNLKLRALVRRIATDTLREAVSFENYEGEDLEATCKHCQQDLWLVWEKKVPAFTWTECGGIGEGSCSGRHPDADAPDSLDEPAPPTLRSPSRPGESTKVKRSI
jgi:hypothetical protein